MALASLRAFGQFCRGIDGSISILLKQIRAQMSTSVLRFAHVEKGGHSRAPCCEGAIIKLDINTLTSKGQGLGRYGSTSWVLMVSGALPGESVEVRVVRNFRRYSEGLLLNVLNSSKDRIWPRCPIFQDCSGCQYQHLAYDVQLVWKRKHVQDALVRIAGFQLPEDFVENVVPSPMEYHYRTKLTPHFQANRRGSHQRKCGDARSSSPHAETHPIGFLEEHWGSKRDETGRRWKQVIDVAWCPIATEAINAALPNARAAARRVPQQNSGRHLLLRHTQCDGVVTDANQVVTEELAGLGYFAFRAGSFFQNNTAIMPSLVSHVVRATSVDHNGGGNKPLLVDLYCGVGVFAVASGCTDEFDQVFGADVDAAAIDLARKNARMHGLQHARFLAADVAEGWRWIVHNVGSLAIQGAVVILDPPRQGLSASVRASLVAHKPRRLVYVSCDVSTQSRDLRHFVLAGYSLVSATPFDLFPQTRHVEVVVVLDYKHI